MIATHDDEIHIVESFDAESVLAAAKDAFENGATTTEILLALAMLGGGPVVSKPIKAAVEVCADDEQERMLLAALDPANVPMQMANVENPLRYLEKKLDQERRRLNHEAKILSQHGRTCATKAALRIQAIWQTVRAIQIGRTQPEMIAFIAEQDSQTVRDLAEVTGYMERDDASQTLVEFVEKQLAASGQGQRFAEADRPAFSVRIVDQKDAAGNVRYAVAVERTDRSAGAEAFGRELHLVPFVSEQFERAQSEGEVWARFLGVEIDPHTSEKQTKHAKN